MGSSQVAAASSAPAAGRAGGLLALLGVRPTPPAADASPVADPTPISQAVLTFAAFAAAGGMTAGAAGVRAYAENAAGGTNHPT
ncbi:MAG TPA: hypothetical protein VFA26_04260 [Gemmataceae bacterium]|nr:hypothetical protein [Gemmataceae bacterium]